MTLQRFRVLQHGGRRYALRLEPAFWTVLEEMSVRLGTRLNLLVAGLAAEPSEAALAARLRLAALNHLRADVADFRQRLAGPGLVEVLEDCPSPAFALGDEAHFIYANAAFRNWLGSRATDPVGRPLDAVLRLTLNRPVREILAGRYEGEGAFSGKAIHMEPGRLAVKVARARPIRLMHDLRGLAVHLL